MFVKLIDFIYVKIDVTPEAMGGLWQMDTRLGKYGLLNTKTYPS